MKTDHHIRAEASSLEICSSDQKLKYTHHLYECHINYLVLLIYLYCYIFKV